MTPRKTPHVTQHLKYGFDLFPGDFLLHVYINNMSALPLTVSRIAELRIRLTYVKAVYGLISSLSVNHLRCLPNNPPARTFDSHQAGAQISDGFKTEIRQEKKTLSWSR